VSEQLNTLARSLDGRRVLVLTGAGVSTESGIPDYRSPESLARPRAPVRGPDFVRSAALRRRYWARGVMGWPVFRRARPNASHLALARLEARAVVQRVITQNVDRLHTHAGSRRVLELHGALAEVVCLDCGYLEDRDAVQARMQVDNREWLARAEAAGPAIAPDGDADLPDEWVERFEVPSCERCHGVLKPNVVFFGENVARPLVDEAFAEVDAADVLLVAGTSLAIFSGYRFLRHAVARGMPVAIVNRGPVRGEEHATVKVEASTGDTLAALAERLLAVRISA
jgi:NAD-dependent SIR2 family protein deacetylase